MKAWWPALLVFMQGGGLPPASAVIPERVGTFAGYTEGIVFDAEGTAYVSLPMRGEIARTRPGAEPETWATVDAANGHKILGDGTHLVAARKAIVHLNRDGAIVDTVAVASST